MQSHLECRLWNEVFVEAQRWLGIPSGEWRRAACGLAGQGAGGVTGLGPGGGGAGAGRPAAGLPRAYMGESAGWRFRCHLGACRCAGWSGWLRPGCWVTSQPPLPCPGACAPPPPPAGTIKATCLIETLPAAFEMHEFLYELRDHSAGTCLPVRCLPSGTAQAQRSTWIGLRGRSPGVGGRGRRAVCVCVCRGAHGTAPWAHVRTCRPQLRALGLHVLLHQNAAQVRAALVQCVGGRVGGQM